MPFMTIFRPNVFICSSDKKSIFLEGRIEKISLHVNFNDPLHVVDWALSASDLKNLGVGMSSP